MTVMEDFQDVREVLKPRRAIMASRELRERIGDGLPKNKRHITTGTWMWRAAASVAMIIGVAWFAGIHNTSSSANDDCIVYVEGKQVSDNAARSIAEADVAKMEQFMLTVARQRAEEEAKVNQFMQHKPISR